MQYFYGPSQVCGPPVENHNIRQTNIWHSIHYSSTSWEQISTGPIISYSDTRAYNQSENSHFQKTNTLLASSKFSAVVFYDATIHPSFYGYITILYRWKHIQTSTYSRYKNEYLKPIQMLLAGKLSNIWSTWIFFFIS